MTSSFSKFYKKSFFERIDTLHKVGVLSNDDAKSLKENTLDLPQEVAEHMIENQIGYYTLPMGTAFHFLIDGKDYTVPMSVEEPSVIAAANYAAKIIKQAGGFTTNITSQRMIGQIAFTNVPLVEKVIQSIQGKKKDLLKLANDAHPSIVKRGGGARDLSVRVISADAKEETPEFFVIHFFIDTLEAMGANIVNTMMEAVAPTLEAITKGTLLMGVLSNYATDALATANCLIPTRYLRSPHFSGEEVRDRIIEASQWAWVDPYRATTNNKGIFNGIDAVVLASGNDWRAIEAGGHAYASRTGQYRSLSRWKKDEEGNLIGQLTLPLPLGTVGGSISIHPHAQLAKRILQYESAEELESIVVSVGLAQNFAALKALVTEGIQRGHMSLQAKSLAISVGAIGKEVEWLTKELVNVPHMNSVTANELLTKLRKNT